MKRSRWVEVSGVRMRWYRSLSKGNVSTGRIAQSVERSANNAVVLGSSPSMTIAFNSITQYLLFFVRL